MWDNICRGYQIFEILVSPALFFVYGYFWRKKEGKMCRNSIFLERNFVEILWGDFEAFFL